jgi:catechol 2,3-dioxygenase-like lactoylglutathione lyase family enzyme
MEILAARVLVHPVDMARSLRFYRDELGLAVFREFPGGTVFFLGGGYLELSGAAEQPAGPAVGLWLQVRDLDGAHRELVEHVVREPRLEPWGLREMWVADPDGTRIVLVEVPSAHPMRRDVRAD